MRQPMVAPESRFDLGDRYQSWDEYENYLKVRKQTATGWRNAFMPDPQQIVERIELMRKLESLGFNDDTLDAIMIHDCPPPELVFDLLSRTTIKKLRPKIHRFVAAKPKPRKRR